MNAVAKETGPGFELRNQSKLNIMFRLFIKGKKIIDTKLAPNNLYQWEIDLNDPLVIEVYEPLSKNILNKVIIDAKGKTKYIAWDPKRYNKPALYFFPQIRDDLLAQDLPTTRFNLDNNVEQTDIKWVR
jgi:hypothetical protein